MANEQKTIPMNQICYNCGDTIVAGTTNWSYNHHATGGLHFRHQVCEELNLREAIREDAQTTYGSPWEDGTAD